MLTIESNGYEIFRIGTLFLVSDTRNRAHRLTFTDRKAALEYTYAANLTLVFDSEADTKE